MSITILWRKSVKFQINCSYFYGLRHAARRCTLRLFIIYYENRKRKRTKEIFQKTQISVYRAVVTAHCRAGACSRRRKMEYFSDFLKENNRIVPTARHFALQNARRDKPVKSNMVYRLCNNMVYTFALGSPSKRYAFLSV